MGSHGDVAPSGGRRPCGFGRSVPYPERSKPSSGSGVGDGSEAVSDGEGSVCAVKRAGSVERAEPYSPKKRRLSGSDVDLCTVENGCLVDVSLRREADGDESESVYSVQSKVTDIVKDSSDDLWFLHEDEEEEEEEEEAGGGPDDGDSSSVDVYSDEYEVASEHRSDGEADAAPSSGEDVVVPCDASDNEFFADCEWSSDDSYDDDDDLLGGNRKPDDRFSAKDRLAPRVAEGEGSLTVRPGPSNACDGPCHERFDAELEGGMVSVPAALGSRDDDCAARRLLPSGRDSGSSSLPPDLPSASTTRQLAASPSDVSPVGPRGHGLAACGSAPAADAEDSPPSAEASCGAPSSLCVVCLSGPKEATIVHGTTGHQSCCYECAVRLKRRRRPCPVCRRPIQTVVRNYL